MKVIHKQPSPSFKWLPSKAEANLIKKLPQDVLDNFSVRLMNAPMEDTLEASEKRDTILREVLELARKLCD